MNTYLRKRSFRFSFRSPEERYRSRRKGAVLRPVIQAMQQHQPTTEHETQTDNQERSS